MKTETQLTKEDVKALCMHAPTAQDPLKQASDLRGEAREAENMAQLQEAMLTGYQANLSRWHDDRIANAQRGNCGECAAGCGLCEMAKEHEALASRLQENTTATK